MTLREEIEAAFRSPKGFWMRSRIEDPKNAALIERIKSFFPGVSRDEAIWLCWNETTPPKCLLCNGSIRFKALKDGYTSAYCSIRCGSTASYEKGRKTKILKGTVYDFGSPNFNQLMIEKYGAVNAGQVPEIQTKITTTLVEKYGITSGFHLVTDRVTSQQSEKAREKKRETNLERYGSLSPFGSKKVQAKSRQTLLEHYGVENPMHSSVILERMSASKLSSWRLRRVKALETAVTLLSPFEELSSKNARLKWECVSCKKIFISGLDDGKTPRCTWCKPTKKIGRKLAERFSLLIGEALGAEKQNDRTVIYPYELDFYWAEKKLAVEFSGLYWHGELIRGEKRTEFKKLKQTEAAGIRLLTFYEDELRDKPEHVRSVVLAAGGIFERRLQARKLKVAELKTAEARSFADNNHLQGYTGGFLRLGLKTVEDELVAIMIVGKSRFAKSAAYELIRYCQLLNTQVVGAFGKLLAAVKECIKTGTLISYTDNRIFTGKSYLHHGFQLQRVNKPGFYWTDYTTRFNRQTFQKHKLIEKHAGEKSKTAAEIMATLRYDRVWDCGQSVYELSF